jgi:NAD+ synthase
MAKAADQIVGWMREQTTSARADGLVVGLSGGVDSAVVARLCQLAYPDTTVAVLMPCHSDPQDEAHANLAVEHFGLTTARIDLGHAYDTLVVALTRAIDTLPQARRSHEAASDIRARVPAANVKPRLRMAALYFLANSLNYLVAGTGNRSEISVGYYTKYGDGGVDLLPLGDLVKGEVRALAVELGVPAAIVERAPSAGLWAGQTDEAEMGFTYEDLETYLERGPTAVASALRDRIEHLVDSSRHKRTLPPSPGTVPAAR